MLKEDTSTTDVAIQPDVIGSGETYKDMPVFCIEKPDEFHSFCKGRKTFQRWRAHTKSEEIRTWARSNPGKSFAIKHNDSYMVVNRSKGKFRYAN